MSINEKIRSRRLALGLTGEFVARELNISRATYYRYETSTAKIPASILDSLCKVLRTTPSYFLQTDYAAEIESEVVLPASLGNPQEAMEFILKIPTLAAYGGYDPSTMTEQELMDFAYELLNQLKLVSYKYKK